MPWSRWGLGDLITHDGHHQSRVFIFVNIPSGNSRVKYKSEAFYGKSDQISYDVNGSKLRIQWPVEVWNGRITLYRYILLELADPAMAQKALQLLLMYE
jgi:hypothetical protein